MAYTTRRELLEKVARNDEAAWREFVDFYAPLIDMYGRAFSLAQQELEELRQNVYVKLFTGGAVAKYLPERGKFRTYLRAVISNWARDVLRARADLPVPPPEDEDEPLQDPQVDERFEEEWKTFILEKAKEEVRRQVGDVTWLAFDMYVLRNLPVAEVAEALKVTPNAVYLAKSHITARLAEAVKQLSQELG
jgi:RNA polymerase sigma factor (sigma-70 family)